MSQPATLTSIKGLPVSLYLLVGYVLARYKSPGAPVTVVTTWSSQLVHVTWQSLEYIEGGYDVMQQGAAIRP